MSKMTSIFKNKKFKYGATSIVFTSVCIALIIVFNIVFTALSNQFLWSIDMTEEQLFTLSDESKELLKDVDKEITITFCMPLDTLESSERTNLVYQCAREYEANFDNVKVDCVDIIANPTLVEKYANTTNAHINKESIIVKSDDDFRTFSLSAMFATDSSTGEEIAFSGEIKFTTALLQLSEDKPIAYFTTGHGETTGNENGRPALWTLFEEAGYEVKTIDLTKEDFEEKAHVLIVNAPKYDFLGAGNDTDEITKIGKFLDRTSTPGNLMVFLDPTTPDLPELEALLEEWGIKVEDAVIRDNQNSLSADSLKLNSVYSNESLGSQLTTTLQQMDSMPKTVSNYTRPLSIIWTPDSTRNQTKNEGYSQVTNTLASRYASPVLMSYDTAVAYSINEPDKTIDEKSPYNLMTITRQSQIIDSIEYSSYVMVTGSTEFASDAYLNNVTYANDEILYSAMRVMGKENIPTNLQHKYFHDDALEITQKAANNWTIVVVAVVPMIVFGIGLFVQIRRKHL